MLAAGAPARSGVLAPCTTAGRGRCRLRVLARSSGNGQQRSSADSGRSAPDSNGREGTRESLEKQRKIAQMLMATQKNMLELNNSRVKVQEELAVANRRIADLERELDRMRAEQARQQALQAQEARLPAPFSPDRTVAVAAPPPVQQPQQPAAAPPPPPPPEQVQVQVQQQPQQPQQPQAVPPPPAQQAPAQEAAPAVISITYVTGWHNAFIHCSVDGKPWTTPPGLRLETSRADHAVKTINLAGSRAEFVMTNGDNDWDSPARYSDKPRNYEVTSPGAYRLKSGRLEKTG